MSSSILKVQLQLTSRVVVTPRVAANLTSLRGARAHMYAGVLFGRWPSGFATLSLEAVTSSGDLEWQRRETPQPNPFTVQPAYVQGWQDALLSFPHVRAPGQKSLFVGRWVVLPPPPSHPPLDDASLLIQMRQRETEFLQRVRNEGWLDRSQAILIVQAVAGKTCCQVYAFDPMGRCRLLELDETTLVRPLAGHQTSTIHRSFTALP